MFRFYDEEHDNPPHVPPPPPPPPHGPWRNLGRHLACVPKGFLKFRVLWLLKEKPMSGSEIMDEIEKETHGFWKPSPGSIYPLLAWLQDKGYIKEVPSGETGVKRYAITEQGLKLLEEQANIQEKMRRIIFFAPRFIWFLPSMRRVAELRESFEKTIRSLIDLEEALREKFDEETLKEASRILNEAAEKIEGLAKKAREK
ncbi:MAG: PadR family transcriptional regulator [Candidatus Bathyarchaeia archaeon]